MKYLFIAFLFISSFISGQGIEPTSLQPSPYRGGFLKSVTPIVDEFTGDTTFIYVHTDSLGLRADSIYVRNDSILLRDGQGFVKMSAGWGLTVSSAGDSITYVSDTTKLATLFSVSGTNPRIPYFGTNSKLTSTDSLKWNASLGALVVRDIPFASNGGNNLNIGQNAGSGATSVSQSFFFGFEAGKDATGAYQSNFHGLRAGSGATGSSESSFYGYEAGKDAINSYQSNFIGAAAGRGVTDSYYSNFFGASAGLSANAYSSNFFGLRAGQDADGAVLSNFFGQDAGRGATNSYFSNFFGFEAGKNSAGAHGSNFFGPYAGYNVNSVYRSNFFGYQAGSGATYGYLSNYFGANAGLNATVAYISNFIGYSAGDGATNAGLSNLFGYQAGKTFGSNNIGLNNIIIGTNISLPNAAANRLNIGNVLYGSDLYGTSSGDPSISAKTDGKIGIAVVSPQRTLHVQGEARITDLTTDPATAIVGHDADGDLSSVTVGNGLTIDAGTLTVTANINGTQNRVAKFTSQYSVGNSEIYTVGDTLVGINQSNPQYHLDVSGKFRVTDRTGVAVTGAGFTSNGQLISYSLDTAAATPNTYISSGSQISITGSGTMADPYTINNSAPENTSVKDGVHIDFAELSNDTITGTIIAGSIGPTEITSTTVTAGSYTLMSATVDQDGRITSASNGTAVTSIGTTSPITGGTITSNGTIGINNALSDGATKGAATFTTADFNDNLSGLISLDYTNGQAASGSTKGYLTSTDWNTFNNKAQGTGIYRKIAFWESNNNVLLADNNLGFDDSGQLLNLYGKFNISKSASDNSIAIGGLSGGSLATTGVEGNVSIGGFSGYSLSTSANNNLNIGARSGYSISSGSSNTNIGVYAGYSNVSSANNINIGSQSGYYNTGDNNVNVGAHSGRTGSVVTGNVNIGSYAGYYNTNSNRLYINNSDNVALISGQFDNNLVGIQMNAEDITRTLDINGELRVRDLTTTTPTYLISADNNGVLSRTSVGSGLGFSSGILTGNTGTVTSVGLTAGTGISVSGSPVTSSGNITVTNTGVTSLNGLGGSMFLSTGNSGTYPNWSSSGTTLIYNLPSGSSGQVLKHNGVGWTAGTDNNTDAQTLSFSSPNLSISGGNSVTLPVLPSGSTPGNGIRWTGSAWEASTLMSIAANAASTKYFNWNGGNSYLGGTGISTSGNVHLVAGGSGVSAARLMGQDASDALTGVTIGSGLSLSSGTLSYSPVYAEVSYIGPSSAITSWTSIPWNQTAISNGMTTSSSGITIPTTGNYRIDYSVHGAFSNNVITGYSGMSCRVFSSGIKGTRTERVYHSNTQVQDLSISHQSVWASLTAGTVVYVEVQQSTSSGSTLTITAANLIVTKL